MMAGWRVRSPVRGSMGAAATGEAVGPNVDGLRRHLVSGVAGNGATRKEGDHALEGHELHSSLPPRSRWGWLPGEERSCGNRRRVGIKEDRAICSRGCSQRGTHHHRLWNDGGHSSAAKWRAGREAEEFSYDDLKETPCSR